MAVDIIVPVVGESISEVYIGEWLKKAGESVEKDEPIVEIETDKATLEVPAPVAGTISETLVAEGDSANVGDVIGKIQEGAGSVAAPVAGASDASASAETVVPATPPVAGQAVEFVMPAAQRLLEQHNLTASAIPATGPGGRLLKEDVERYIASGAASASASTSASSVSASATPQVATVTGARHEERVAMSPLRRTVARRLVESQHTTATLTTFNEADMTAVMNLRKEFKEGFEKKHGVRLGFMSFFVRAVVEALKTIPQLNAYVDGEEIIYHNYYDIGIAVSGKKGLLVPVIRNAERMSFAELERAVGDYGQRAQKNRIMPEELEGGTFTISNGGVFGSMMSTPILNPPQSGVLGMHNIIQRPVAINGTIEIRPMMYLALSYDHRIIDGRESVTFLKTVKEGIENPARLLLEV